MGTSRRVRSLGHLVSWLFGSLSLLAPVSGNLAGRLAGEVRAVAPQAAASLAPASLVELARAAAWVSAAGSADKVAMAIRKDPKGFAHLTGAASGAGTWQVLAELPYGDQIAEAAAEHSLDGLLVASVVEVESTFDPEAGSHRGAVGLMQLLPSTAGLSRGRLLEPAANLDAGAEYLAEMIERFDGDLELALAAYNAGPTNVRRYEGVPPFRETEQYVEKVLSRYVEHHLQRWQVARGVDLGELSAA
jgi:soluble lytic murein transglycosylase-like protein